MASQVDWCQPLTVAELGAANGVLTKGLLSRMSADTQLNAYEINPQFIPRLKSINDKRLNVVAASVEQLIRPYDVIFLLPATVVDAGAHRRSYYATNSS